MAQYSLKYTNLDVILNVDINFARTGLTRTRLPWVGDQRHQTDLTSPNFTKIANAIFYPDLDQLGAVYDTSRARASAASATGLTPTALWRR